MAPGMNFGRGRNKRRHFGGKQHNHGNKKRKMFNNNNKSENKIKEVSPFLFFCFILVKITKIDVISLNYI